MYKQQSVLQRSNTQPVTAGSRQHGCWVSHLPSKDVGMDLGTQAAAATDLLYLKYKYRGKLQDTGSNFFTHRLFYHDSCSSN